MSRSRDRHVTVTVGAVTSSESESTAAQARITINLIRATTQVTATRITAAGHELERSDPSDP